ncbi:transmembrane protein 56 [Lingula anatina]|uniref:Transmembrane protein 56 n=1 Tax=Lingula anatina TaxID=7574 RepID=A0A1S3JC22_LINAN|nr:transmembrane protein 56 [Lingula anatina]|eukprot:XP_013407955.2 transmembrane protein 56 [Lingula anatina]
MPQKMIMDAPVSFAYYPTALISCVISSLLFQYCGKILAKYMNQFSKSPLHVQIELQTLFVSGVHAIIVSFSGLYVLLTDERTMKDSVWGDCPQVRHTCAIVVGYLVSDFIIMIIYYKEVGGYFYFIHHLASIYAYVYVITFGVLEFFANFRLLAEFSTPFVNMRRFLEVEGYPKSSKQVLVNGFSMVIFFFVTRVAVIPPYYWMVYSIYGTPAYESIGHVQYVLVGSCAVLDILNVIWFFKMCRGAHKVLKSQKLRQNNIEDRKAA